MKMFRRLFFKKIPCRSTFKKKILLNIVFCDLVYNYKGNRHYKSLPVNAQSTRNNYSNASRLNITLKIFKLKQARAYYGNLPSFELYTALAAEYLNLMFYLNFGYN
jgi:hypothetical protein